MNVDRKRLIEDYRQAHPGKTMGHTDPAVEAMVYCLEDVSTEALTTALSQRYWRVTLRMR